MNESILYGMEKDAQEQQHTDVPIIFLALAIIFILVLIALV